MIDPTLRALEIGGVGLAAIALLLLTFVVVHYARPMP